jgi:hypothetical protein
VSRRRHGVAPASEPMATHEVRFSPRPQAQSPAAPPRPTGRLPRVARLLALAHRIDGMIRAGEIRDWADAARVMGVTRARMTQVANLTLLSPPIQAVVLGLDSTRSGKDSVTEHALRRVVIQPFWRIQERHWGEFRPALLSARTT